MLSLPALAVCTVLLVAMATPALADPCEGRLAGLYFDRARDRIVVRLTGAARVAPETHTIEGRTLQVVFEPGARNSLAELNDIMAGSAARSKRRCRRRTPATSTSARVRSSSRSILTTLAVRRKRWNWPGLWEPLSG